MSAERKSSGLVRAALGVAVACGVAGAVAIGVSYGWDRGSERAAPVAAAGATELELGREVCGDCCESRIWNAIGGLSGVSDVVATPGKSTIVVHHDGHAGIAQELVANLRKLEYPEAELLGAPADVDAQGRVWVRPVAPMK
jgi:copper chaperone CopZ